MSMELERERVVQQLAAHYARDHLSTGELESRFEQVYKAQDAAALNTVLAGLPAIDRSSSPPVPLHQSPPLYQSAPPTYADAARRERRYLAAFSSVEKKGDWNPEPQIRAIVVLGSIKLDLRDAAIPMSGIDIFTDVVLGNLEVILPPGLGSDVDCTAVMGSVEDKTHPGTPGAPIVRIRGGTVLGEIKVVTKFPKEQRLEKWRRQLRNYFGSDE